MNRKLDLLQRQLADTDIDCAVIGPTTNMTYLLGGAPHADERLCVLLITPETAEIVAPVLNAESIRAFTDIDMITWEDAEGPAAALARSVLAKSRFAVLAVDGAMRSDFLLAVSEICPPQQFVAADPVIGRLRVTKSPDEIAALQRAAEQADRAMRAAVDACRPGVTEAEVAWAAESAFRADGAERVEFTLVAAGKNAAQPHHHSGNTLLREGEGIILDIGASLGGYKSDITRVVHLGDPSPAFEGAYNAVLAANKAAGKAVRPGASAESVDAAARNVLAEAGHGEHFIHRTGHGIGMDIHEEPYIQQDNSVLLAEGMTFSIEPGVYYPGDFGIRIEDIAAVTESGVKILTGFDHALIIK